MEDQRYNGIAELLGWDWTGMLTPDTGPIEAGSQLDYALFWAYLGKQPEERFFLRLIGPDDRIWGEATSQPTSQYADIAAWRDGQIIEERGAFSIPPETPPGRYTLQIGFYTAAPAVTSGELTFPTPVMPLDGPLQVIEVTASARQTTQTGPALMELELLTQRWEMTPEAIELDLIWQAPHKTEADYQVAFALIDPAGETRWAWKPRALVEFLPTSVWPVGRGLRSQWRLPIEAHTPGGPFTLQLQLIDDAGQQAVHDLGSIEMAGRVRNFSTPQPAIPLSVEFAQAIALRGLDTQPADLQPGQSLGVTLIWQSLGPLAEDYTVFLQLLGPSGQVITQQDKAPLDGAAPTTTWTPGETISDSFTLALPDALPPGEYRLITGFYHFESGQRLATPNGDFALLKIWRR